MIPKFRYWDKHKNRMISNTEIVIWNGNAYKNTEYKIRERLLEGKRGLVGSSLHPDYLMQSTGLFDKHGKEIFEGDIVKSEDGVSLIMYDQSFGTYFKEGDNTYFSEIPSMLYADFYRNALKEEVEIIGNIYENPEILEDN